MPQLAAQGAISSHARVLMEWRAKSLRAPTAAVSPEGTLLVSIQDREHAPPSSAHLDIYVSVSAGKGCGINVLLVYPNVTRLPHGIDVPLVYPNFTRLLKWNWRKVRRPLQRGDKALGTLEFVRENRSNRIPFSRCLGVESHIPIAKQRIWRYTLTPLVKH